MNKTKTMTKPISHVEKNRVKYMYCREIIVDVLGWNVHMMEELKIECGCQYIEGKLQDYPAIVEDVKYTPGFFWPWFMNQWALRDEEFVLCYNLEAFIGTLDNMATATRHELMEIYCKWHQDAIPMAPMQNGFDDMLHRLIKHLTR